MRELMALDSRREVLEKVLPFVTSYVPPRSGPRISGTGHLPLSLPLRSREEIVAFLGAIPLADPIAMLISRSPQLGPLEQLVWGRRTQLQPFCIALIESGEDEDAVLVNAIRVLLLLGDERAVAASARHRGRKSRFGNLATFLPVMLSRSVEKRSYEQLVLDPGRDFNERIGAFVILSIIDGGAVKLLKELESAEPERARGWRFMFLMTALIQPSEEVIPLLEEALGNADGDGAKLLAPLVAKVGELPGARVTDMLVQSLSHASPEVRLSAVVALQTRRSHRALAPLWELLQREENTFIVKVALVAFMASGPVAIESAATFWSRSADTTLWRWVLAGRLRAESEAPLLVATATDAGKHWQLRRAAILAASRLPFESALAQIVEPVMRERSSFTMDANDALLGHAALCAVLVVEPDEEQSRFFAAHGVEEVWSVWFDTFIKDVSFRKGTPDGRSAARWALQQLRRHVPPRPDELQRLIDELHVPILHAAVLRGLRLAGRYDLIEEIVRTADSEWLLVRACCEYGKGRAVTAGLGERLGTLVAASRFPESPGAAVLVKDLRGPTGKRAVPPPAVPGPPPLTLSAADITAVLAAGELSGSFVASCRDKSELQELVHLLDPANDYVVESVAAEPDVSFVAGSVSVGGAEQRHSDNNAQIRAQLRPAVAAANRFDVTIPWHLPGLSDRGYLAAFLRHLGVAGDAERFYEALARHGDVMVPQFADSSLIAPILELVDTRLIPHLSLYAGAGTDNLLESLCSLAQRIDDPSIDPVLASLFARWFRRFDPKNKEPQHDDNIPLWRALGSLRAHPRFRRIPDYDLRLMELLHVPMRWFHKDEIVKTLLDCPRSYIRLEAMLLKSASFEHWHEDEVDRLDAAADTLFRQVQDA